MADTDLPTDDVPRDFAVTAPAARYLQAADDWNEITFWEQALAVPARRNVKDPKFGGSNNAVCVFDNLIHAGQMPVTIGVFISAAS